MTNLPAYVVVKERRGQWAVGTFGGAGPLRVFQMFNTEADAKAYAKVANEPASVEAALDRGSHRWEAWS